MVSQERENLPQIVLTPESLKSSFKELCHCIGYHTDKNVSYSKLPVFCEDIMVRDQYIEILRAQGGKQLGGSIGSLKSSLAWSFKDAGTKLLATTMPLKPSRMTGITYSNMPIILKFILEYLGFSPVDSSSSELDLGQLTVDNVPVGESQMKFLDSEQLPNLIHLSNANQEILLDQQKENRNIEPIREFVVWALLILLLIEAIYYLRKSFLSSAVVLLFLASYSQSADAVSLSKLGSPYSPKLAKFLKNEVEGRTSISFDESIKSFPRISSKSLKEPWLWSSNLSSLRSGSPSFNEDLRLWLRRGGFLIIEGDFKESELSSLTSEMEGGSWKVVAPDHEIMVSFHLLNSLPECNGNVWKYYSIDNRMAVLNIPYGFLSSILRNKPSCVSLDNYREQSVRIFINILMVALTTDYKKDQVHLPEILKRLR